MPTALLTRQAVVANVTNAWLARFLAMLMLAVAVLCAVPAYARNLPAAIPDVALDRLPVDARSTYFKIKRGGPFPFAKDGSIFANREGRLPRQPRGFYTEYTVRTPGSRDRGARRIVVGGEAKGDGVFYYTDDHYQSFMRIRE